MAGTGGRQQVARRPCVGRRLTGVVRVRVGVEGIDPPADGLNQGADPQRAEFGEGLRESLFRPPGALLCSRFHSIG